MVTGVGVSAVGIATTAGMSVWALELNRQLGASGSEVPPATKLAIQQYGWLTVLGIAGGVVLALGGVALAGVGLGM
jgi:hypothetical protein